MLVSSHESLEVCSPSYMLPFRAIVEKAESNKNKMKSESGRAFE